MQMRQLFILSTGHNSGVPRIFEWMMGANREQWGVGSEIFLYFLL